MIIDPNVYRSIAQRLLAKTRDGSIRWMPDTQEDYACMFPLPRARVRIIHESPTTGEERLILAIENRAFVTVGRWEISRGSPDWDLLAELYELASRMAFGWGEVLEELDAVLGIDRPVTVGATNEAN